MRLVAPAVDRCVHGNPERGSEPAHRHSDERYIVLSPWEATPRGNRESHELRRVTPFELEAMAGGACLMGLAAAGLRRARELSADRP